MNGGQSATSGNQAQVFRLDGKDLFPLIHLAGLCPLFLFVLCYTGLPSYNVLRVLVFCLHGYLCTTCMPGVEDRRGRQISGVGVTDGWELPCGIKPRSSGRAVSALNC